MESVPAAFVDSLISILPLAVLRGMEGVDLLSWNAIYDIHKEKRRFVDFCVFPLAKKFFFIFAESDPTEDDDEEGSVMLHAPSSSEVTDIRYIRVQRILVDEAENMNWSWDNAETIPVAPLHSEEAIEKALVHVMSCIPDSGEVRVEIQSEFKYLNQIFEKLNSFNSLTRLTLRYKGVETLKFLKSQVDTGCLTEIHLIDAWPQEAAETLKKAIDQQQISEVDTSATSEALDYGHGYVSKLLDVWKAMPRPKRTTLLTLRLLDEQLQTLKPFGVGHECERAAFCVNVEGNCAEICFIAWESKSDLKEMISRSGARGALAFEIINGLLKC